MTLDELVELYLALFAGRPDVYAIRTEWEETNALGERVKRAAYLPSVYAGEKETARDKIARVTADVGSALYGDEAVLAHVTGKHFLGVYPLHADSSVKFFALDFDGDTLEEAWQEALIQQETFKLEARITTYLEVSRSGNGVHLWGFLDGPVDAGKVRAALKPFLVAANTYDRMFPNQSEVTEAKPLGNLIALPLFGPAVPEGKGVFVHIGPTPVPFPDQKAFLQTVERIPVDRIMELYEIAPPIEERAAKLRDGPVDEHHGAPGMYKLLSPRYGCEFIRWCWDHADEVKEPEWWVLAGQLAQLEGGREWFHRFSERDPSRYNVHATDEKFDHAVEQNGPQTCEWIRANLTNGPGCRCDERFPEVKHPYDLVKVSVQRLVESLEGDRRVADGKSLIIEALEWGKRVEENPEVERGILYGIAPLDEHTNLRGSELIVIGGRPGSGKTALAVDVVDNVALAGHPAYFFSQEMSCEQLGRRMLCKRAGIDHGRLITGKLTPEEWGRAELAAQELADAEYRVFVNDTARDTAQILDFAGEWIFEHGPGPVFIDYLQLGKKRLSESTFDAISRIAYEYKWMSKILGVPVICLAQLNRTADEATLDSQTYDHWLRNSGDIEQAADVIIFILGERTDIDVVQRALVIHKERHRGGGRRVLVEFNQPQMRFAPEGTWGTRSRDLSGLQSLSPLRTSLMGDQASWLK